MVGSEITAREERLQALRLDGRFCLPTQWKERKETSEQLISHATEVEFYGIRWPHSHRYAFLYALLV